MGEKRDKCTSVVSFVIMSSHYLGTPNYRKPLNKFSFTLRIMLIETLMTKNNSYIVHYSLTAIFSNC